jgi:hypothetical protein
MMQLQIYTNTSCLMSSNALVYAERICDIAGVNATFTT